MKFQVVSIVNRRFYCTGTDEECQEWLKSYGGGWSQFEILPFDSQRKEGDIADTY